MGLSDLIYPGDLWLAETTPVAAGSGGSAPTESAVVRGSGFAQQVICAPDIGSHFWLGSDEPSGYDGDFEITVAAEHGDQSFIEEVVFWLEGRTVTVSTQSKSARTGVIGYSCVIDASACTKDGDANLYITVRPVNGYERLLGPFVLHLNHNGGITRTPVTVKAAGGNYTTIDQALAAVASGGIITVDAGTYEWTDRGASAATRCITVRPAEGLSAGDVVITRSARGTIRPTRTYVEWRDIEFDTSKIIYVDPNAGATWVSHYRGCRFVDPNGAAGPTEAYYTADTAAFLLRALVSTQQVFCEDCYFETIIPAGATSYVNCSGEFSYDALALQTAWPFTLVAGTNYTQASNWAARRHVDTTLTITGTPTFDAVNNRTTFTVTTANTLDALTNNTVTDQVARFLTGALAGKEFLLRTQNNTTKEIIVAGEMVDGSETAGTAAAAADGDTLRTFSKAHVDAFQFIGPNAFENILLQRYKVVGTHIQPWLFQPGNATAVSGTISTTGTAATFSTAQSTFKAGMYIRLSSGSQSGEMRRIASISSGSVTTCTLASAFSVDQSGTSYQRVGAIKDVGIQLCVFDHTGSGSEISQWQDVHEHVVVRQTTHVGTNTTFRNGFSGFSLSDVSVRDSVFYLMNADSGFPSSGVTIVNNHYESGTARDTSGTAGEGDVTFDANYRPTAGLTLTVASPKLLWDYHGNALANDGTDLVGAAQASPASPGTADDDRKGVARSQVRQLVTALKALDHRRPAAARNALKPKRLKVKRTRKRFRPGF